MMQGLLDDPNSAGLLSLGLRLMSTPGKFGTAIGQAGLGAMGDIQQMKAQQQAQKTRALQEQMLQMQLQQATAEQQRRQAMQEAAKASFSPGQMLPEGVAGPQLPPQFDVRGFAERMAALGDPSMLMDLQKKAAPIKVGKDDTLLDPMTMKPVFEGKGTPEKEPEAIRALKAIYGENTPEYLQAVRQYGKKMTTHAPAATAISYGSPVPVQLPDGSIGYAQPSNRQGAGPQMMTAPDGTPLKKPGDAEKPLTEGQAKAVSFASRMKSADQTLAQLARKGVQVTVPGAMGNNAVGSTITAFMSPEQQQLAQAKRDFVNAVLRRESGAVISPDEFANAERQYFPQVGDSRQVIEQKAKNRRIAIEGMAADIPKGRRAEVDAIVNGGASEDDPLGLR